MSVGHKMFAQMQSNMKEKLFIRKAFTKKHLFSATVYMEFVFVTTKVENNALKAKNWESIYIY